MDVLGRLEPIFTDGARDARAVDRRVKLLASTLDAVHVTGQPAVPEPQRSAETLLGVFEADELS